WKNLYRAAGLGCVRHHRVAGAGGVRIHERTFHRRSQIQERVADRLGGQPRGGRRVSHRQVRRVTAVIAEKQFVRTERAFEWVDLAVFGLLVAVIYAVVTVAREWSGPLRPIAGIHTEAKYLPLYALFSLTRGLCAYGVSFLFTMVYGYAMARVVGAERVMLPVLDILQSIPVLGFLPGFVLGLVHLFPHRNLGLEIASVLMIFTGQVWNMTFSFYSSLKSIPPDLV